MTKAEDKAAKRSKPQPPSAFPDLPDQIERPHEITPLPPQPATLRAGIALIGQGPVRVLIGGHMQTVFLTDYDESSNTYDGLAIRCHSGESSDKLPVLTPVHGLRPYDGASNKDFQFVIPGVDESPLINLAQANAVRPKE